MDNFKFVTELIDKVTKPASSEAEEIEKLADKFEQLTKATRATEKAQAKLAAMKADPKKFKEMAHAQRELREEAAKLNKKGLFDWANPHGWGRVLAETVGELGTQLVDKIVEAPKELLEVVADIGKEMIKAAGQAERFKISFTSLLGDVEGTDLLEYVEHISKATEATDDELKGLAARLLTVGFDAKELEQVLPASLDIAGFLGGGVDKAEAAAEALAHIKTTGEISKRSLGSLGLQWTQVMKELQKETGLSEEGVKKQLESGKFGPQALHAVLQSIANKEGGQLGTTAEKMAGSLDARLKKLRDVPGQIFQKWADTPGFKKFSDAIGTIVNKLDPDGPNGAKIFTALDRASEKVVTLVDKFASSDGIDKFASGVSRLLDQVDKIPGVLDKVATVSEVVASIWAGSKIIGAVTTLTSVLPALGTAAGSVVGIVGGLAAPILAVAAAIGATTFAVVEMVKAISTYRDVKRFEAENGITDDLKNRSEDEWKTRLDKLKAIRDKTRAERGLPAIASQSSRVQSGGGIGSQTVNLHPGAIAIHAPGGNADEIADAVNQSLPGAMQQGFERMSVASGVL